jgi:hypothetical protein
LARAASQPRVSGERVLCIVAGSSPRVFAIRQNLCQKKAAESL